MSQAYLGNSRNSLCKEYWPSRETWQVDTSKETNKRGDDRWETSTLEAEKKVKSAKTFTTALLSPLYFIRLLVLVKYSLGMRFDRITAWIRSTRSNNTSVSK
jgi:hypothetical protein